MIATADTASVPPQAPQPELVVYRQVFECVIVVLAFAGAYALLAAALPFTAAGPLDLIAGLLVCVLSVIAWASTKALPTSTRLQELLAVVVAVAVLTCGLAVVSILSPDNSTLQTLVPECVQ